MAIPSAGRKPGHARKQLLHALSQGAEGDYVALAGRIGMPPSQVHQTVRSLAHEGLIEPCAKVPSGARPRNVYRAADPEPGHQFMARTLLEAWR